MKFSRTTLKKLRVASGRSPEAVSQDLATTKYRISINTLVNWENGLTKPTGDDLERLAKIYKCDLLDFFTHETNQTA